MNVLMVNVLPLQLSSIVSDLQQFSA